MFNKYRTVCFEMSIYTELCTESDRSTQNNNANSPTTTTYIFKDLIFHKSIFLKKSSFEQISVLCSLLWHH